MIQPNHILSVLKKKKNQRNKCCYLIHQLNSLSNSEVSHNTIDIFDQMDGNTTVFYK